MLSNPAVRQSALLNRPGFHEPPPKGDPGGGSASSLRLVVSVSLATRDQTDMRGLVTADLLSLDRYYRRLYRLGMTSVVKRTISVPADVFAAVEAEVTASQSLSTLFSEGARLLLRQRAGERAVTAYEAEHGPISQDALREADRLLDEAGLD